MVLAIDIGNTNVVIGGFQENQILFVERVSTNQNATSLELAISIKTILEIYQIQTTEIEGCIISSVVPSINHAVRKAVDGILAEGIPQEVQNNQHVIDAYLGVVEDE